MMRKHKGQIRFQFNQKFNQINYLFFLAIQISTLMLLRIMCYLRGPPQKINVFLHLSLGESWISTYYTKRRESEKRKGQKSAL